jgi:flavin-dependent dehydrogenase
MHDVVIIGGGPAGLSAALNGAAEGLSTLLLERSPDLGGQARRAALKTTWDFPVECPASR